MKLYTNIDVLTAAKSRIRYAYEECKNVLISVSGGKDSTVVLELSIEIAREMGRLPVIATFLDQESEYEGTIDYMRYLQTRPDEIKLWWWQIPFVLTNSTSSETDNYLHCWKPGRSGCGIKSRPVFEKDIKDRMASTIRHNRARGKHVVDGMVGIIYSLLQNGWTDERICNELGMQAEELVRIKYISGYAKLYENVTYTKSWIPAVRNKENDETNKNSRDPD